MRWNDIFSLTLALAVPLVLLTLFPWRAMGVLTGCAGGGAALAQSGRAGCAFVTLTPEEEGRARTAARAAWQRDRGGMPHRRIDLFEDALPPLPQRPAFSIADRAHLRSSPSESDVPSFIHAMQSPTLAAPPPVTIAPSEQAAKPVPAFSREELLTLPTTNN